MLSFLKTHPFAVETLFERSLVLTYAAPKEELQPLIPECLSLDTFEDKWGFVAVAMVQTRKLRPKGFPEFTGNDFCLTGYRIFTRYTTREGKRLRGLYIIRSETDKRKMSFFGNLFTHYNYTTTDIAFAVKEHIIHVTSKKSGLDIVVDTGSYTPPLPPQSPFRDWKEARRYEGPLPFTFTYDPPTGKVLIIEGVRQNWEPQPVQVITHHSDFIDSLELRGMVLANAFLLQHIPYHWKKGRTEIWKQ